MMPKLLGYRLEDYTIKYPQEVLIVTALVDDEADQVAIYRGFSSSLMRPTAFDPDVPILPASSQIIAIDRLQGPFDPDQPQYLEQGLSLDDFVQRLNTLGL